jgi:hypothetical protein
MFVTDTTMSQSSLGMSVARNLFRLSFEQIPFLPQHKLRSLRHRCTILLHHMRQLVRQ